MAAVTQNSTPIYNVIGSKRQQFYNVTGATGNTLDVGMTNVIAVNTSQPATITGWAATKQTPTVGSSRIAFTSGGTYTAAVIEVIGT